MFDDYKTKLSLTVDWADLDLFGHVNNVAFFRYIQAARVRYCDIIGLGSLNNTEFGFIVASTHCDFKKPLDYPGQITVHTKVEAVGKTSISLNHVISNSKDEVVAEGRDVLVVFDYKKREKAVVSKELMKSIGFAEGREIGR
jgi:acyl-CoA thioester hydrolase